MENFPRLWAGDAPLKHREANVAELISSALSQFGASPLSSYPELNAADAHATLTIALLDVYRDWRKGGWLGAGPFTLPHTPPENRSGLFVTLHEDQQFDTRLIDGVAESGLGGTVVIPNLLRKNRKFLAARGFQTPNHLQPLNEALETASILVHHGGMGSCTAGIGKAVPQLIIHSDLEKYHNGKAIADAGAGISLEHRMVTKQSVREAIQELTRNPAYGRWALRLAEENNAVLKTCSIAALADLAESIL
jgi:hypothetical protein